MPILRLRLAPVAVLLLAPVACFLPPVASDIATAPGGPDADAAREAAEGVTAFAANLHAQLRGRDGNLIVSPFSINSALATTAAGAQGTTRAEMEKVLHLPAGDTLAPAYRALTESVTRPARGAKNKTELTVANSLWLQKGRAWKKEYLAIARSGFHAGLFEADFADPGTASRTINRWVEKETRDRVRDVVLPSALDRQTRIILANAIYFKARWAVPFRPESTQSGDFAIVDGTKTHAQFMRQTGEFLLREEADLQVLRLPHDGEATAMYVVLPRKADGLPAVEEKLTAEALARWSAPAGKDQFDTVSVWLPKFKFAMPSDLGNALQKIGLVEPFGPKANFQGMTEHPEGVLISRVLHKAFVEVDEAGTEAAAATAVTTLNGSAPGQGPSPAKEFRADRPFLFVITHQPTGTVLFLGRVLDPTH